MLPVPVFTAVVAASSVIAPAVPPPATVVTVALLLTAPAVERSRIASPSFRRVPELVTSPAPIRRISEAASALVPARMLLRFVTSPPEEVSRTLRPAVSVPPTAMIEDAFATTSRPAEVLPPLPKITLPAVDSRLASRRAVTLTMPEIPPVTDAVISRPPLAREASSVPFSARVAPLRVIFPNRSAPVPSTAREAGSWARSVACACTSKAPAPAPSVTSPRPACTSTVLPTALASPMVSPDPRSATFATPLPAAALAVTLPRTVSALALNTRTDPSTAVTATVLPNPARPRLSMVLTGAEATSRSSAKDPALAEPIRVATFTTPPVCARLAPRSSSTAAVPVPPRSATSPPTVIAPAVVTLPSVPIRSTPVPARSRPISVAFR